MDPALRQLIFGKQDEEIEAIIRVKAGSPPPPSVRVVARFGEIITCRLKRQDIESTWSSEEVMSVKAPRVFGVDTLAEDLYSEEASAAGLIASETDIRRPEQLEATGRGVVVGVVDWGFDFAHPNFRNPDGTTRALGIWDQSAEGPGPEPYGYGCVYTRDQINAALQSSNPYLTLNYHPASGDPRKTGSHGTHVHDIAAGNGSVPGSVAGIAPEADLIFVHLSNRGTSGRADLGNSVTLLEALDWIHHQAGDRPWTVNLSVGRHGGEHTGETLVEQAIDMLLLEGPGRFIGHSTGNYYQARAHAMGQLRPGQARTLGWITDKADITPNELEIWYSGKDNLMLTVMFPDEAYEYQIPLGEETSIELDGREVGHIYHRANDPLNGDNHIDIFLYPEAPAGRWSVKLTGEDVVDGRYHCWVERDAACLYCQSRLAVEDAEPKSTTGTICNGFRSIAVGAYNAHLPDKPLASFSSSGPTRDGRVKPDLVAPGVHILAARSALPELGEDTPKLTRYSGTSMASPHVVGTVALMFQTAGRLLSIQETRRLLLSSTDAVEVDELDANRIGSGYLNSIAAVEATRLYATNGDRETDNRENLSPHRVQESSSDIKTATETAVKKSQVLDSNRMATIETPQLIDLRSASQSASNPEEDTDKHFEYISSEASLKTVGQIALLGEEDESDGIDSPDEENKPVPGLSVLTEAAVGESAAIGTASMIDTPTMCIQCTSTLREQTLESTEHFVTAAEAMLQQGSAAADTDIWLESVLQQAGMHSCARALEYVCNKPVTPAAVFDLLTDETALATRRYLQRFFDIIGSPGQEMSCAVQAGDIILRRGRGEGGLAHACVTKGEAFTLAEAADHKIETEYGPDGFYVQVIEGGARPHGVSHRYARQLTGADGRLAFDQIVLRPKTVSGADLLMVGSPFIEQHVSLSRPCCILAPSIPFGSTNGNIVEISGLGTHRGSNEENGIIYTGKAGFVDVGHVRDLCDLTKYVYDRIVAANGSPSTIRTNHGEAKFGMCIVPNYWITVARSVAYDDSLGYEIYTYGANFPGGHNSSFSPEDLVSNFLGTLIAEQAINAGGMFNTAVTNKLRNILVSLNAQSSTETLNSFNRIRTRWVNFSGSSSVLSNSYLRRRNFTRTPWKTGHTSDRTTPAWVTAAFTNVSRTYRYTHTTGRTFTKSRFRAEIASVRVAAQQSYGANYDRP